MGGEWLNRSLVSIQLNNRSFAFRLLFCFLRTGLSKCFIYYYFIIIIVIFVDGGRGRQGGGQGASRLSPGDAKGVSKYGGYS